MTDAKFIFIAMLPCLVVFENVTEDVFFILCAAKFNSFVLPAQAAAAVTS